MSSTTTTTTTELHPAASYNPKDYWIAPKRNFRSSARLHMQHLLFQRTLNGRLLHPDIDAAALASISDKDGETLFRLADLGCGNGVWLADVHESLTSRGVKPERFQLDGFDINPVNFPPGHTFPANIHFTTLDILDSDATHGDFEGKYDVVHLRAWSSIVTGNDPSDILCAAMKLLRPGGYIQWEETRVDLQRADCAPGGGTVGKTACDALIGVIFAGGAARGNTFGFLASLGDYLTKAGFVDVTSRQYVKRGVDMKAWTENYLTVWEEIPDLLPSKKQAPDSPVTKEKFAEMFAACVAETERGVVVHQEGILMVTGRKLRDG